MTKHGRNKDLQLTKSTSDLEVLIGGQGEPMSVFWSGAEPADNSPTFVPSSLQPWVTYQKGALARISWDLTRRVKVPADPCHGHLTANT